MAYEPAIFAEWTTTVLRADATLLGLGCTVWGDTAVPPTTPLPYIMRTAVGGPGYLYSEGLRPVWYDGIWYFTAYVAGGDTAQLDTIMERINALLQRGSGTTAAGRVLTTFQSNGSHSGPPDASGGRLVSTATVEFSALVISN